MTLIINNIISINEKHKLVVEQEEGNRRAAKAKDVGGKQAEGTTKNPVIVVVSKEFCNRFKERSVCKTLMNYCG